MTPADQVSLSLQTLLILFAVAMALAISQQKKSAFVGLLIIFALVMAYYLRAIFMPAILALIIAYMLNPMLTWLEKKDVPRLYSIGGIYGLILIGGGLILFFAIPAAVDQGTDFFRETFHSKPGAPSKFEKAMTLASNKMEGLTGQKTPEIIEVVKGKMKENAGDLAKPASGLLARLGKGLASGVGAMFALLSFLVLIPVYLFFFLKGMNSGWAKFKNWLPKNYRKQILASLLKIHKANAAFFRGAVSIALIDGFLMFVLLWFSGVKFSFLFGVLYAVLALVPFLGPVLAFAVTAGFVLADTGTFGSQFIFVVVYFVVIQILETAVLQPMILGKETGLHPVMIILALLIFGQLFGFFGMLLAIPLFSASLILIQDYVLPVYREVTES